MSSTELHQGDKHWYVVTVYSGFEQSVMKSIQDLTKVQDLQQYVDQFYCPSIEHEVYKAGKVIKEKKPHFPGYVFIKMSLVKDLWSLIVGVPRVTGFLGGNYSPKILSESEYEKMVSQIDSASQESQSIVVLKVGDRVKIIEGSLSSFDGIVSAVDAEKQKVNVVVKIFDRENSVELFWNQVSKRD